MRWDVNEYAEQLRRAGQPFVLATVIRVVKPVSAHPGDRAIVTPDGTLEGWIGGACSEPVVVREALRALGEGTPRVVRIGPPEMKPVEGTVTAVTTCPSGGMIEVFLEPVPPDPHVVVFGEGLVARTLTRLARTIGYRVTAVVAEQGRMPEADVVHLHHLPPQSVGPQDGVVVATLGHWDEEALGEALRTPAEYVALVASRRRAEHLFQALRSRGVAEEALHRVRAPAGLNLGPATQEEIALAVLAEYAAWRARRPSWKKSEPEEAIDPVCGMTVAVRGAACTAEYAGRTYYFCHPSCKERFLKDPLAYVA